MTKERPILFSGPMVREILEGRKTQTRRVMKPQPLHKGEHWEWLSYGWHETKRHPIDARTLSHMTPCPYGTIGDRLWVREHHARGESYTTPVHYFADGPMPTIDDRHDAGLLQSFPSIHMSRWASRINLLITDIRVERLQDISEADAIAEGVRNNATDGRPGHIHRYLYRDLWESIHGTGSWDANQWVWVVEFNRMEAA